VALVYLRILQLAVHAPPWLWPVTNDDDLVRALEAAIAREN
jgi:hypothetical protein